LYFSLSPEDEAKQIAKLMIDQGITTPVIINNGGALAERMQSAFISTWESYGALQGISTADGSLLPQITFTDNKSMRIGITSALDVLQSQRRISQMESLGTDVIHSVTRNRRDIDAFVVFALPDQVELINPIIEASISLFSETALPVYASSYSYQHQLNKNSIRDLRNLFFVDMPWLMPEQRNSELAKEVDSVWNQPSSSYLRLFAFGFDSFQFAERFGQLSFFKQNRLQGLSGTLQVNDIQQVVRELPVASVGQDAIEMMK
jgi:outer membrane PBP1 activator LpoA protein